MQISKHIEMSSTHMKLFTKEKKVENRCLEACKVKRKSSKRKKEVVLANLFLIFK